MAKKQKKKFPVLPTYGSFKKLLKSAEKDRVDELGRVEGHVDMGMVQIKVHLSKKAQKKFGVVYELHSLLEQSVPANEVIELLLKNAGLKVKFF